MASLLQSPKVLLAQQRILDWLKCGVTPRQLAFTIALGFAIGCIPLVGVTTAIWLAMPLQVILLIPFLRLGQWLFPGNAISFDRAELLARMEAAPWHAVGQMGSMLGHAVLAWSITATPALLLMTLLLTPLMHRVSKLIDENC
jgi:uncharacterized protein (DUF2062 family)